MRTTLLLQCIPAFACALCSVSGLDAAERLIRPRRTNRPAGRITARAPAAKPIVVASPVTEDGVSQAPLRDLTPPDSALLKSGLTRPAELMREFGELPEDTAEQGAGEAADSPPPSVSPERYQEMNRQRQDFHPPLTADTEPEATPETAAAGAPPPAPAAESVPDIAPEPVPESAAIPAAPPILYAGGTEEPRTAVVDAPPTPAEVESYRRRLEFRLLERYNNLPEYAGEVGKVSVVLSKPLQPSLDGTRLRAEFDQLVYDPWGRRIPSLEKEYYVVTFSAGGVRQVRSDPSIRVGLNHERTYSEPGPDSDIAERIRTLPSDHAFRAAPRADVPSVKMPDWWRPEFSDDAF